MGINSNGTTLIDQGVFQNIGAVTWDTTAKTSGFTAVSGNGYFVNTTSGAITVTLPSSPSAGDIVGIADYANTADTNAITIGRNGSNIQGQASNSSLNIEGGSIVLLYVDATQGWVSVDAAQASDVLTPTFITATGGTITTSGDYKIHTFTSPGTFTVSCAGNPSGSDKVDYLVIAGAGGGAAGNGGGGGGGAGGYRFSDGTASGCYSAGPSPLGASALPVSAQGYPITIGGGGAGGCGTSTGASNGNPSIFSSITSTGGGGGGGGQGSPKSGSPGGSGGGAGQCSSIKGLGGNGNVIATNPPQGNNGGGIGGCVPGVGGLGGGGAGGIGVTSPGNNGTQGGPGLANSINASATTRGGGGSGGTGGGSGAPPIGGGAGGSAGGSPGSAGTANTGGGGGGGSDANRPGGAGGSGIVIIRYKYQ